MRKRLLSIFIIAIAMMSLSNCSSSSGSSNQNAQLSKSGTPKALKFRDNEEKRIVMEAAGIGGGLGLGIGLGSRQNTGGTIGLGTIGSLIGGAFGVKQVSDIRKLKLRAKDITKLIAATDRRTGEVKDYNLALRQYLVNNEVQVAVLEQKVAERKKVYQGAQAALAKTEDSIAHIEAAIMKSPEGNSSPGLRQSHQNLMAEKYTLQQQTHLLASN